MADNFGDFLARKFGAVGHFLKVQRARGGLGTETIVEEDDVLHETIVDGWDGTEYVQAGRLGWEVDGTPGVGDVRARAVLEASALEVVGGIVNVRANANALPFGAAPISASMEGDAAGPTMLLNRWRNSGNQSVVNFQSARGTEASPEVVQNNDNVLIIRGRYFDGVNYQTSTEIRSNVDGAPSSGVHPGSWDFLVAPSGGGAVAMAMRIRQNLQVQCLGSLAVGVGASMRGVVTLNQGTGTNTPGTLELVSRSGTSYFFWVTNAGVLRIHTALPTSDTDGSAV